MLKLDQDFVPRADLKPSGNESLVEKWILDRLNVAADEVNKQMTERNFFMVTNVVYNFWLYELCDVYIEAMKPMTDESASGSTKKSAQQTLYTCLDYGLRLLHPLMPFVTEELWQRLPRIPNDTTPSIMVSKYPVFDKDLVFEDAVKDFNLVFSAVKAGRSLAASYSLQNDIQLFVQVQSEQGVQLFESQVPTIVTLIKGCKSVKVVKDINDVPAGCGSEILTPTVVIHILVRGFIDFDVEIAKCEKKLNLARLNLEKIRKVESQPDYEETVPENVRLINEDKRKAFEAEVATLEQSKGMFEKLK